MRKNLDSNLEGKKYKLGEQEFHFKENPAYSELLQMAQALVLLLIKEDEVNGCVQVNEGMIKPAIAYIAISECSDADLTRYVKENAVDILAFYDDYYKSGLCDSAPAWVEKLEFLYLKLAWEQEKRIEAKYSLASLIRNIGTNITGDEATRDIGILRKLITDAIIKNKNAGRKVANTDNVVDFSAYKTKNNKE